MRNGPKCGKKGKELRCWENEERNVVIKESGRSLAMATASRSKTL